jgi:hypothetical protein
MKYRLLCKNTVRREQNICYLYLPTILQLLHFSTKPLPVF